MLSQSFEFGSAKWSIGKQKENKQTNEQTKTTKKNPSID